MARAVPGRLLTRAALFLCLSVAAIAQSAEQVGQSQQAKQFMAEGRFADAAVVYRELSKALPANVGLRLNLALALHMSGQHEQAIPEFERVLKADPQSVPALVSLGAAYLETGQPTKAIVPLKTFLTIQPDHIPARGMLASALLSLNEPKAALEHFRKLTSLAPEDPKAWHGLGRCYEALSKAAFEELNKTGQGSAEWLALIAESRLELRQYRSAFYFYKQALEKKRDFADVHASLADLYRRTGHADWAELEQQKASSAKPDCVKEKARCAFAAKRYSEAAASSSPYWRVRAYNELARLAFAKLGSLPESVELHAVKAEILTNHGNTKEAVSEWRAAKKLAPGDYRVARQLAIALYKARDHAAAVPAFEELLRSEPDDPELHFYLGDSWLQQAQPEKAIPSLAKAVELDSNVPAARAALGMAYARVAKNAEAVPHLTAALPIDEDGSLHYQLARALQSEGKTDQAQVFMKQYQEIQRRSEEQTQKLEAEAAITAP